MGLGRDWFRLQQIGAAAWWRSRLLAIVSSLDQKTFEGFLQGNINIAPSKEKGCLLHAAQLFLKAEGYHGAARQCGMAAAAAAARELYHGQLAQLDVGRV